MTEQQLDAEVSRYEPVEWGGFYEWCVFTEAGRCGLGTDVFDALENSTRNGYLREWARYPTREAAYADLRNAIRAAHELTPVSE